MKPGKPKGSTSFAVTSIKDLISLVGAEGSVEVSKRFLKTVNLMKTFQAPAAEVAEQPKKPARV